MASEPWNKMDTVIGGTGIQAHQIEHLTIRPAGALPLDAEKWRHRYKLYAAFFEIWETLHADLKHICIDPNDPACPPYGHFRRRLSKLNTHITRMGLISIDTEFPRHICEGAQRAAWLALNSKLAAAEDQADFANMARNHLRFTETLFSVFRDSATEDLNNY
ncbi:hypothetical protein [Streptomyces sp. NPDC045369]|uniref:hypothetical protein n=1 Tax=Streptomyces sp. NPDC045369 TaxID=3155732 RepID=UPI0033D62AF0